MRLEENSLYENTDRPLVGSVRASPSKARFQRVDFCL